MTRRLILVSLLLTAATEAYACRCEQRELADYFSAADLVVMARLQPEETIKTGSDGGRTLTFELLASPYKGAIDGWQFQAVSAMTSAACGIPVDAGAVYVVFAYRADPDSDVLRVDTCSGTRVHLSTRRAKPAGFIDVPARFVASQLNALFGMTVLGEVAAHAPREDDPTNATFIGLLDLKALTHGGSTRMFAERTPDATVVSDIQDYQELVTRELGYEQAAAVVYSQVGTWYRLQTSDGRFAWVRESDAGTFFPYERLPIRRLAYLTSAWSGLVWPAAGAGLPQRGVAATPATQEEQAVDVLESARIGGSLWFRVNILDSNPCDGGQAKTRVSGWVPAYGRSGSPTIGYYSRGC